MSLQIAKSFDQASVEKILRGLLISLEGAVYAGVTVVGTEATMWLKSCVDNVCGPFVIHWNLVALAALGAFLTSVANIRKQYYQGEPDTTKPDDRV